MGKWAGSGRRVGPCPPLRRDQSNVPVRSLFVVPNFSSVMLLLVTVPISIPTHLLNDGLLSLLTAMLLRTMFGYHLRQYAFEHEYLRSITTDRTEQPECRSLNVHFSFSLSSGRIAPQICTNQHSFLRVYESQEKLFPHVTRASTIFIITLKKIIQKVLAYWRSGRVTAHTLKLWCVPIRKNTLYPFTPTCEDLMFSPGHSDRTPIFVCFILRRYIQELL